jgi:hypothetical protein
MRNGVEILEMEKNQRERGNEKHGRAKDRNERNALAAEALRAAADPCVATNGWEPDGFEVAWIA